MKYSWIKLTEIYVNIIGNLLSKLIKFKGSKKQIYKVNGIRLKTHKISAQCARCSNEYLGNPEIRVNIGKATLGPSSIMHRGPEATFTALLLPFYCWGSQMR